MASPSSLPPEFDRGVVLQCTKAIASVPPRSDLTFSTVLGSCISACVRDVAAKLGGMNHFLLAEPSGQPATATAPGPVWRLASGATDQQQLTAAAAARRIWRSRYSAAA
jgi:hypothetical protein